MRPSGEGNKKQTDEKVERLLIDRVLAGDKRAFDLLVLRYQGRIISVISRYLGDPHEAQDIAQDTFVRAYRSLHQFQGDSSFFSWLYRIAINTSKNHITAMGRRPPRQDFVLDDSETFVAHENLNDLATPDRLIACDKLHQAIRVALESLPEESRSALTLHEMEGLSYEEVAQTLDIPIGTVRSRISRARRAIEKMIEPMLEATGNPQKGGGN